jgi:hypothetical protein
MKPSTGPHARWAPTITSFPARVKRGTTVALSGTQLCGLSEVSSYGDDNQQSENYPVARLASEAGTVRFLRTHDVSTRSIAPKQAGTVYVDIPDDLTPGFYTLKVVAMGVFSPGVNITVIQ